VRHLFPDDPQIGKEHDFAQQARASDAIHAKGGRHVLVDVAAAHVEAGTVDWTMTFPDGSVARAHARVVANVDESSILTFVLLAPPVPQEAIEGTLAQQKAILSDELRRLKSILEDGPEDPQA
jgi:hypothetical protein